MKKLRVFATLLCVAVSAMMLSSCGQISDAINTVASKASAPSPTAVAGNGTVTVFWPKVSGALKYNIYWSATSGVTPSNGTAVVDASSPYTITHLENGKAYYFVVTSINVKGESGPSVEVTATPSASAAPYIRATVLTPSQGTPPWGNLTMVQVSSTAAEETAISDAVVSVNGVNVPWNAGKQEYDGNVAVAPGASVTVNVTVGGKTYTATGTQVTMIPVITAPVGTGTWSHTSANTITWTPGVPTTGNVYVAGVVNNSGNFVYPLGDNGPQEIPTTSTTYSVPANSLAAGSYQILVGIGTPGIANGTGSGITIPNAVPGSALFLGGITFVPITVE